MGPPGPCPRVTRVTSQIHLGGLGGGLSSQAIECLLQEHAVTHLVVCGHHGADAHVAASEAAAAAAGVELHVAPLVPKDREALPGILHEVGRGHPSQARKFLDEALEDDLNCVLVACSKGASRSVAVVLAHLVVSIGRPLQDAFDELARCRWRIWPSALLVEELLTMEEARMQVAGAPALGPADRASIARRIGAHAAWATAWHNGCEVDISAAEAAWDTAAAGGGGDSLEAAFRRCKQELLGVAGMDLVAFGNSRPPHAEPSEVVPGLLLCGLGGLSPEGVGELLSEHAVRGVVACGRPGRDTHIQALLAAMSATEPEGSGQEAAAVRVHIVPIADSDREDLLEHLAAATDFLAAAVDSRGSGRVLVCCRQGASRSASVAMAFLMAKRGLTLLEAFRALAATRWRLWPNAGFVQQLLQLEARLKGSVRPPPSSEAQAATLRAIGVHAAWAANRQNLEENGAGRPGLTLQDAEACWEQAAQVALGASERFERCKALALGVDLAAFDDQGQLEPDAQPLAKLPRRDP